MHEFGLINDLMKKIAAISAQQGGHRVVGVKVQLGAMAHISPEHFREHFVEAARGTRAEQAVLEVVVNNNPNDSHAQDILLLSVDVEVPE